MRVRQHTVSPPDDDGTRTRTFQSVGPWRLVRPLGEGTWCQVFQAAPLDAPAEATADYAIKLLKPSECENRDAIAQLQNEAHVARLVDHPHVSSVLAWHCERPPYYLILPYQGGWTVREQLQQGQRVQLADALWIVRQVAEGLNALHEQRWSHCDVKPENVQLAPNGHATLCDLGLACRWGRTAARSDRLPGTLAYLPPEAFAGTGFPSAASDAYALGVVLFEILTGQRPFPQQDASELVAAHRLVRPPDPRLSRPDVPSSVVHLLRRLMAKEPLRRPTGEELMDWLVNAEIDSFDLRDVA